MLRSSYVLKYFAKLQKKTTGPPVPVATSLKKRLWQRCYPVDCVKFLRIPLPENIFRWLIWRLILVTSISHDKNCFSIYSSNIHSIFLEINLITLLATSFWSRSKLLKSSQQSLAVHSFICHSRILYVKLVYIARQVSWSSLSCFKNHVVKFQFTVLPVKWW